MRELELRDVGPFERLTIPVPEDGGLVVLRGPNGAGKSHALGAVQALMGDGRPVTRDGSMGASVEGLGARLIVARRASRSGELQVEHLEGEDPSLLVDPGLKSAEAADAERIRALCRLARAQIDPVEAFAPLVGGEAALRELCRESTLEQRDVPTLAAAVKRDLEASARKAEQEAKNLGARAEGVVRTLDDIIKGAGFEGELPEIDSREARAAHEAAVRSLSEAEGAREVAERLFRASSEASIALAYLGDRGTPAAVKEAATLVSDTLNTVKRREDQLRAAQEALRVAEVQAERAQEIHEEAVADERQRRQLERAIAEADGVEATSDETLAGLRRAVDTSRELMESASIVDRSAGLRAEAERLKEQAQAAALRGSELRHAAQSTERIVTEAVSDVCPDDMHIEEGRLMVVTSRGLIPFAELSQGERWRRSIDISVNAVGEGGVLVVRQEALEGLDPKNRQAVAEHARKRRTVILSAEASDGELRAEVEA